VNFRAWPLLAALLCLVGPQAHSQGQVAKSGDRPVVRFLIGSRGAFNRVDFIKEYAQALHQTIQLVPVESTRGPGRLIELQTGEADVVINASQAAYLAFSGQLRTSSERFDRLRAITTLGVVPLHLVARADSGIKSVVDLRGRSVSLGIPDGEAYRAAVAILEAFGVNPDSLSNRSLPAETAVREMRAGKIQALFVVSGYPAEAVREALSDGSYLVPIDGPPADRLRARSGFLYPALVPAGTYPGQTKSVRTLGTQNLLVTHRDVDEQVVYELTRQFFVALPKLSALDSTLRHLDVDRASATSIPLHDGAARYYRERELFR
jgi:TRAP transporter TAXI family solute receptor